jgi:hypothetical protein
MVARYTATIHRHHGYNTKPRHKAIQIAQKYFLFRGHQGKERAYLQALKKAGYKASVQDRMRGVKFVIYDMDGGMRLPKLERYHKRGVPIFMYPHAARPQIIWDGIWEIQPFTTANFVPAPGHKEVMERYGYPIPIEVTGWSYCDILPFQPIEKPVNILFGPIHPSASGWMCAEDLEANQRTHKLLIKYCRASGSKLTVRHIRDLKNNGLEKVAGVTYIQGRPDLAVKEIDQADVVIGHQTFAYLAVARGKPTLMMREDLPPHTVSHGQTVWVKSWEKYADIMMYPLDILAGDTAELIQKACRGDALAAAWRERFIHAPFDPKYFVERLESYL